jgi:hypothetical protein
VLAIASIFEEASVVIAGLPLVATLLAFYLRKERLDLD